MTPRNHDDYHSALMPAWTIAINHHSILNALRGRSGGF
jgi:hypothetical protein